MKPYIQRKIPVSALKGISILYEDDAYDLARYLLSLDIARSTPTTIPRHTVNGLAGVYAYLTNAPLEDVRACLLQQGLLLGATIERDEDVQ